MSPAHLRKIYDDLCGVCKKKATQRLHNSHNALIGCYCAKHAPAALSRVQGHEKEDIERERRRTR